MGEELPHGKRSSTIRHTSVWEHESGDDLLQCPDKKGEGARALRCHRRRRTRVVGLGHADHLEQRLSLVCKRHRDNADREHSWILWLGDFTEGALSFDDGAKVAGNREWHKINGHVHHWNDPHEGTKYSIVLSRGTRRAQAKNLAAAMRAKRETPVDASRATAG